MSAAEHDPAGWPSWLCQGPPATAQPADAPPPSVAVLLQGWALAHIVIARRPLQRRLRTTLTGGTFGLHLAGPHNTALHLTLPGYQPPASGRYHRLVAPPTPAAVPAKAMDARDPGAPHQAARRRTTFHGALVTPRTSGAFDITGMLSLGGPADLVTVRVHLDRGAAGCTRLRMLATVARADLEVDLGGRHAARELVLLVHGEVRSAEAGQPHPDLSC